MASNHINSYIYLDKLARTKSATSSKSDELEELDIPKCGARTNTVIVVFLRDYDLSTPYFT
jgi:hypothetical protein